MHNQPWLKHKTPGDLTDLPNNAVHVEKRAHKPRHFDHSFDPIIEIFGAVIFAGVILWVAIAGISWAISAVAGLL